MGRICISSRGTSLSPSPSANFVGIERRLLGQVRLIRAANKLHIQPVHIRLDIGRGGRRAAVGHARERDVAEERANRGRAINAADGAGAGGGADQQLQTADLPSAVRRAIAVNIKRDVVANGALGVADTRGQQVDDRRFAAVLDHFQARDRNRDGGLRIDRKSVV